MAITWFKVIQGDHFRNDQKLERVSYARVLGITLNDRLSATDYVNHLLTSCSSLLYAMRVLRGHGISTVSLQDVFRATILAKITYCLPAWSGLCSASDRAKLISEPLQAPRFLWQYCTHHIRQFY